MDGMNGVNQDTLTFYIISTGVSHHSLDKLGRQHFRAKQGKTNLFFQGWLSYTDGHKYILEEF